MNLAFNELSFLPFKDDDYYLRDNFILMTKTFKKANEKFGFSHIVFPSNLAEIKVTSLKSFYKWAEDLPTKDKLIILTFANRKPFSNEVLEDQIEDVNRYSYENTEFDIEETYCTGLSTAFITETASIGLSNHDIWRKEIISFKEENIGENQQNIVSVFNVYDEESVDNYAFSEFSESIAIVELIETNILPTMKPVHFRQDHGIHILNAFAAKIRNSPYVTAFVNSLPFNNRTVRFIRNVFSDGKIEIVLHWEDAGYGMIISDYWQKFQRNKGYK